MEGCYIPFDWEKDFEEAYRKEIRYLCLIFSREYIETHFEDIRHHACAIEARLDDSDLNPQDLIAENERNFALCKQHGCRYLLIDGDYKIEI